MPSAMSLGRTASTRSRIAGVIVTFTALPPADMFERRSLLVLLRRKAATCPSTSSGRPFMTNMRTSPSLASGRYSWATT